MSPVETLRFAARAVRVQHANRSDLSVREARVGFPAHHDEVGRYRGPFLDVPHTEGAPIVEADLFGKIRVFQQDLPDGLVGHGNILSRRAATGKGTWSVKSTKKEAGHE